MKAYDLIIFDWDGTLADSISRIVTCYAETFRQQQMSVPSETEMRSKIGLPLAETFRQLAPNADEETIAALTQTYRDIWLGPNGGESPLFEGLRAYLDKLKSQNYRMMIATGKSRNGLEREMKLQKLGHYFEASRCGEETKAKPDPLMLNQLIALAGVKPERTLMIGDTRMDLVMARNAGAIAVGVTTGADSEEQLRSVNPHFLLNSVLELDQVLLGQ